MILAYKGFDLDLSCTSRGNRFQYAPDRWNEEPRAKCGENGFHCAENPLDCLTYYPCMEKSVYYLVVAAGDINDDENGSRISCTRLRLVKRLNLEEFVAHSLNYIWNHPLRENNRRVCRESGTGKEGFVIVRGKAPRACGKLGDVFGIVKEKSGSREGMEMGLYIVDGKEILPDTWYNVHGNPVKSMKKGAAIPA